MRHTGSSSGGGDGSAADIGTWRALPPGLNAASGTAAVPRIEIPIVAGFTGLTETTGIEDPIACNLLYTSFE
jgi:hypothetical protein